MLCPDNHDRVPIQSSYQNKDNFTGLNGIHLTVFIWLLPIPMCYLVLKYIESKVFSSVNVKKKKTAASTWSDSAVLFL